MIMKNPGQVLLTKEEAVTLRMFLKELSCPDSKVSCDICPLLFKTDKCMHSRIFKRTCYDRAYCREEKER